jgi:hypothetical protein
MHDGSGFSVSIADYRAVLRPGDEGIIRLLSLFAEIAESLDRSESGQVGSVNCTIGEEVVTIKTCPEKWGCFGRVCCYRKNGKKI